MISASSISGKLFVANFLCCYHLLGYRGKTNQNEFSHKLYVSLFLFVCLEIYFKYYYYWVAPSMQMRNDSSDIIILARNDPSVCLRKRLRRTMRDSLQQN